MFHTSWQQRVYALTLEGLVLCRRLRRHRACRQRLYDYLGGFGLMLGLILAAWLLS